MGIILFYVFFIIIKYLQLPRFIKEKKKKQQQQIHYMYIYYFCLINSQSSFQITSINQPMLINNFFMQSFKILV